MKKLFTLVAFAILVSVSANAQFVRYGGRLGLGASYVTDDLLTTTPIMGVNLSGYVDYMFSNMQNPWADNIYLQSGLNIIRRGTNFEQVFVDMRSIRQGFFHNWYVQVPILAGFKYEIPQLPAENFVSFYIGPAVSFGVIGRYKDRQVTPGMPHISNNYDTYITMGSDAKKSFTHITRLDVGIILGVGYQWHNFTFDFHVDHGLVALMQKDDVLYPLDNPVDENGNPTATGKPTNAYTGTNQTFMLSVGYQLPINR